MKSYVAHEQIGYFAQDVIVKVDARLSRMPYAQCGVRFVDGGVLFYSYSSLICLVTDDCIQWGFDALPDFSRTTAKQFNAFCYEYCPWFSYQKWKEENKKGNKGADRYAVV